MIKERAQFYVFPFPNTGAVVGLQQLGAAQTIDSDAPFRLYGVAIAVYNGTAGVGSIALRFSRPDGTWIQKNLVAANAIIPFDEGPNPGAAGQAGANFILFQPVAPNLLYQPRSVITVDIENLPLNSDTTCFVIFIGTKLFNPGQFWSPDLPASYRSLPFLSYPFQVLATQLPAFNLPFNIDFDAGFVWQHGQQSDYSAGLRASLVVTLGETLFFTLTAVTPGVAGNSISIVINNPVGVLPLLVTVVGSDITVRMATEPGPFGPVNSTMAEMAAAIMANPAAAALVTVSNIGAGNGLAVVQQFLFGGGGGGSSSGLSQLGLKIKDWTGKAYMNDYVPAELIFGFDNAQIPGFPYPEIYVPRNEGLTIDAVALGTVGTVTTLCFKGEKIYG